MCAISNIMKRTKYILLARLTKILEGLGEAIKLARLRRKLSVEQVAERAGISRSTLWQIEKGLPNVSMGYYAQVLFVLGLEKIWLPWQPMIRLGVNCRMQKYW